MESTDLRFTTNAYPKEQRRDAWRFALQRLSLELGEMPEDGLYGELVAFKSELGIEFIRITATAQAVKLNFTAQPDFFWLAMLLDGHAEVSGGKATLSAEDGDIVYGRGEIAALHAFAGDNRSLIVKIPRSVLTLRLRTPLPEEIGKLAADQGASRVLGGMLRSVADTLVDATPDQMRPIELSLPEFLLTGLLDNAPPRALGGAAGMRAALLERIFQTIEMRLSDPELSHQQVASEHGISPRYLQKLFEAEGSTVTDWIRRRRLDRCKRELLDPRNAGESISRIAGRWGLADSSHFSRLFRAAYGRSPREFRSEKITLA